MNLRLSTCLLAASIALSAQPVTYATWIARGQSAAKAGKFADALKAGEEAIKLRPAGWEAYVLTGTSLAAQKKCSEAVPQLKKATANAPDGVKSRINALIATCLDEIVNPQPKALPASPSTPAVPLYILAGDALSCTLQIDGDRVGTVPANGAYRVSALPLGQHLFRCVADTPSHATWEATQWGGGGGMSTVVKVALKMTEREAVQAVYRGALQVRLTTVPILRQENCEIAMNMKFPAGTLLTLDSPEPIKCDNASYLRAKATNGIFLVGTYYVEFLDGDWKVPISN